MLFRVVTYLVGMVMLAYGLTLNTMTDLGVSPIVSVAYLISQKWSLNFGDTTLGLYLLFVAAQFVLKKKRSAFDLLQIPVSLLVTRLLNFFLKYCYISCETMGMKLAVLAMALLFTGVGVALSVPMRLVPNPGDGIVQAISDRIGKSMGFTKNLFDCCCVLTTTVGGFLLMGKPVGIGIGTFITMIGVGRVVAIFQHFFLAPMLRLAGLTKTGEPSEQKRKG